MDINAQLAPDSVEKCAKFFSHLPQGIHNQAIPPLINQCTEFIELSAGAAQNRPILAPKLD